MKKILACFLSVMMVIGCASCQSEEITENVLSENSVSEAGEDQQQISEEEAEEDEKKIELGITYQVPMKDIVIDAPYYQEIEQAYTELFMVRNSRYTAVTTAFRSTAADAKDAHEKAFEEFVMNMENYEGGVNSLNITKDEVTTVNGMEVYRFEGTLNYGINQIYDGYVKGYSFIMDGIPCEIIGSVVDPEQPDELIEEISQIVDGMMQSARSEA